MNAPRSSKTRSYHHGDLRRALVEAATTMLREGSDEVTLRGVARRVAVSQTAPYRHFRDRDALLRAVAAEAFRSLRADMSSALQGTTAKSHAPATSRAGLQSLALGYLRFATQHSEEYRLMFGGKLSKDTSEDDELQHAREGVFGLLRNGIVLLQQQKLVRSGDATVMAMSAWSLMHGVSMLVLDGRLPFESSTNAESFALQATELMMFGMTRR